MKLRKTNAILSLITTILLLGHAISVASWMLSRGKMIPFGGHKLPQVLIWAAVAHALVSIVLMISTNKGRKKGEGKHYFKLNRATLVQRVSGALMIVFTWLHIAGAMGIMTPPQVVHAIVPPLFFAMVMGHIAVSVSKALVTLGIGNARFIRCTDVVVRVICAITLVADVVGFYLHVC